MRIDDGTMLTFTVERKQGGFYIICRVSRNDGHMHIVERGPFPSLAVAEKNIGEVKDAISRRMSRAPSLGALEFPPVNLN